MGWGSPILSSWCHGQALPYLGLGFLTSQGYSEDAKFPETSTLKKMKVDEGKETIVSPLLYASAFLSGKWVEVVQV